MRLSNKVVVITGAGSGFGRAASLLFGAEGAQVAVADMNADAGTETVRQLHERGGSGVFIPVDVRDEASVRDLMSSTVQHFGKIDVLYNNAGIDHPSDRGIVDLSEEIWSLVIDVHLSGTFRCCKHGIPHLLRNGGGSIINVGSVMALQAVPRGAVAYSAAKGGIVALTRAVAAAYAAQGIRANVICPGTADTPLMAAHMATPELRRLFESRHPVGRLATTDDIAHLALYLASDESSFMTASTLVIDGGRTAIAQ